MIRLSSQATELLLEQYSSVIHCAFGSVMGRGVAMGIDDSISGVESFEASFAFETLDVAAPGDFGLGDEFIGAGSCLWDLWRSCIFDWFV